MKPAAVLEEEPPIFLEFLAGEGVVRLTQALHRLVHEVTKHLAPQQSPQAVAGDPVLVEAPEQRVE